MATPATAAPPRGRRQAKQPTADTPRVDRPFWTDTELAARYSTHRTTVWRWAAEGKFPRPVKLSPGTTRWRGEDVAAFEAERS